MGWHNVLRVDRIMLHLLPGVKLFAEFRHSHLPALLVVVDLDQNFAANGQEISASSGGRKNRQTK